MTKPTPFGPPDMTDWTSLHYLVVVLAKALDLPLPLLNDFPQHAQQGLI